MGPTEIIIDLMGKTGNTPASIGRKIGVSHSVIWDRLHGSRKVKERNSTNMRVDKMVEMLGAMGYKLVAVPCGKPIEAGEYEIGGDINV